jgi:hypothetical protein
MNRVGVPTVTSRQRYAAPLPRPYLRDERHLDNGHFPRVMLESKEAREVAAYHGCACARLNLGNIGRFRVAGLSFQRTDHAKLGGCNSHGRGAKKRRRSRLIPSDILIVLILVSPLFESIALIGDGAQAHPMTRLTRSIAGVTPGSQLHAADASARARSSELDRALGSDCLKPKPT